MIKEIILSSLAVICSCKTILKECLSLTDATGSKSDQAPNFELYGENSDHMPLYDDSMRVQQVTVCYGNGRGNLKGF